MSPVKTMDVRRGVLGLTLLVLLGGSLSSGASAGGAPRACSATDAVAAARAALADDRAGEAARVLAAVVTDDPACYTSTHGAAAFWLGRALDEGGEAAAALAAWRAGHQALDAASLADARLTDAYLRALLHAFADEDRDGPDDARQRAHVEAADLYLRLVGRMGGPAYVWEAEVLRRHAAQVAPLLPDDLRRGLYLNPEAPPERRRLRPDVGQALRAWWRRQDPMPITPQNERLIEHLRRVAHAERHYGERERPDGLDDRGRIYVRYGPPLRTRRILFNDHQFFKEVFQLGVQVSLGDFPRNEVWNYHHVDWSGVYLFIDQGGYYRLGGATDLLPPTLRRGQNGSDRGQDRAWSAIAAMHYIYAALAPHYDGAGHLYNEIDAYLGFQEQMQNIFDVQNQGGVESTLSARSIGSGPNERLVFTRPGGDEWPSTFAQRAVGQSREADRRLVHNRRTRMPVQFSTVTSEVAELPVAVRASRFLDPDGTTRTLIDWSLPPDALGPTREQRARMDALGYQNLQHSLVRQSAVQETQNLVPRIVTVEHHALAQRPWAAAPIPPQTTVTRGDTGRYHLALQWDEFLTTSPDPVGAGQGPTAQIKLTARRLDSLQALDPDPTHLVLSDLRPMRLAADQPEGQAVPYPSPTLTPQTPLALYFEIYHLAFGADDRTRYAIEVELRRRPASGLRLLGRPDDERVLVRTEHQGTSTTSDELIQLDLGAWEGAGTLDVTVRVRDEVTGRVAERARPFTLAPRPD